MGALALVTEDSCRTGVPESFRFGDDNPWTGWSFAESRYRDLPDHVADVVRDRLNLDAEEWDGLVECRAVAEVVDLDTVFRTARGLAGPKPGMLPLKECDHCGRRHLRAEITYRRCVCGGTGLAQSNGVVAYPMRSCPLCQGDGQMATYGSAGLVAQVQACRAGGAA